MDVLLPLERRLCTCWRVFVCLQNNLKIIFIITFISNVKCVEPWQKFALSECYFSA